MITGVMVAVEGEGQVAFDVISTVTWSPFARALDVNVLLFVPAGVPLILH